MCFIPYVINIHIVDMLFALLKCIYYLKNIYLYRQFLLIFIYFPLSLPLMC